MLETRNPKLHPMKRLFLLIFVPILLLFSCAPKEDLSSEKVPVNIIQPDSMVDVIVDMQLTEAVMREHRLTGKFEDSLAIVSFEKVFVKHNINKEKFEESLSFYKQNLRLYEKIYENVITRLSQLQSEVSAPENDDYE
jgi:hypothetical protein